MRKLVFLIVLSFILFSCKNEKSQGTVGTNSTSNPEQKVSGGSSLPAVVPPSFRETAFLLTDYWVFEFYVLPNNRVKGNTNIGRWYKFSENGTFQSGQWQDITANGTWTLQRDGSNVLLRLDSDRDIEDAEYILQTNTDGDEMSWIATDSYPEVKSVILKAINLMTMPTRKQFGLE